MEHQPIISFEPYYKAGTTESRSYLLKSEQPNDFFKNYVDALTAVHGKWNYSLGGWIFPSKYQNEVRQVINQILSGEIQPKEYTYSRQTQAPVNQGYPAIGHAAPIMSDGNIIPIVGQTLYVIVSGQQIPATLESITLQGSIRFGDGSLREIQAVNGPLQIKGYNNEHKFTC